VPGAFVERKAASVAWHYRGVEPAAAERGVDEVLATLDPLLRGIPAGLVHGRCVVEVRARGIDKGGYVRTLFPTGSSARGEFVLGAGDDVTDLDLYRALPSGAIALHVSGAGLDSILPRRVYAVDSPRALRALLRAWGLRARDPEGAGEVPA
jgi:trehalose 6-phosphate synthase/phosphatase